MSSEQVLSSQHSNAPAVSRREHWLAIEGMDCAACAAPIEFALQAHPAVSGARVNVATGRARVEWRSSPSNPEELEQWEAQLRTRVAAEGFTAWPVHSHELEVARHAARRRLLWQLFVAAFAMMQVMMLATPEYVTKPGEIPENLVQLMRWGQWMMSVPALLFSFPPIALAAWAALRRGRIAMELPATIGLVLCFAWSHWNTWHAEGEVWYDSFTMFLFFLLGARWIHLRVQERVWVGIEPLLRSLNQPVFSRRGSGDWTRRPVAALQAGDRVRLHPGELVPADVRLLQTECWVNEAVLNGESLPKRRVQGEVIPAGAIASGQVFEAEVTAVGQDSTLGALQSLIESAGARRPEVVWMSDRFAQGFLAVVLLAAGATAAAWMWVDPSQALPAVMAVLIVTCPCALSLAAPSAWLAAALALARRGVWIKRPDALETLAKVDRVLFDKTGTLTEARMSLVDMQAIRAATADPANEVSSNSDVSAVRLSNSSDAYALQVAHGLARRSLHPVSQSLAEALADLQIPQAEGLANVREVEGQGVYAELLAGPWHLGRPQSGSSMEHTPVTTDPLSTQVTLYRNGVPVWLFTLRTPLAQHAREVVAQLTQQGYQPYLASGDAKPRVEALAQALGIAADRTHGGLSPQDKLGVLQALQRDQHAVLMVGDGLNDGPAFRLADVSVAVGNAVPLARAQADIVMAQTGVTRLAQLLAQANRTRRVLRLNLIWAASYNALGVPLAAFGWISPLWAGVGMALSSLLVLGHSLTLLKLPQSGFADAEESQSAITAQTT